MKDANKTKARLTIELKELRKRLAVIEKSKERSIFSQEAPRKVEEQFNLLDLISLSKLQKIQDSFAKATDVSSLITDIDGNPITEPSNFCGVCKIIRKTPKGLKKCMESDRILGEKARKSMKPIYQECLSCGFAQASAPIIVTGRHLANWITGQSSIMGVDMKRIRKYALEIGANAKEMLDAYEKMPRISPDRFEQIVDLLWNLAEEISAMGYRNLELARDIEERKMVEKELRFHSDILNKISDLITVTDLEGNIIYMNRPNLDNLGFSPEEVAGKSVKIFGENTSQGAAQEEIIEKTLKYGAWRGEVVNYDVSGGEHILDVRTSVIKDERGNIQNLVGISTEISELKKVERALRESEFNYRHVINSIPNIVWKCDFDEKGNYTNTYISPVADKFLGLPPGTIGNNWEKYFSHTHPEDIERVLSTLKKNFQKNDEYGEVEYRLIKPDGDTLWVCSAGSISLNENGIPQAFGTTTDITERKRGEEEKKQLETQLLQSQKMEALGTLAGGVAHEFNNILGIIMGSTDLAMEDTPEGNIIHLHLERIKKASKRAKKLVKQMLAFSRKSEIKRKPLDMSTIVRSVLELLEASLPVTIEIRQNIEETSLMVMADETHMHQVIMNLCTNAFHAMGEGYGILEINLCKCVVNTDGKNMLPGAVPGSYIKLTVKDTGEGMDRAVLERIFEPYFTTKEPGKGTGLGLSMVYGIVKSYGGVITVDSEPGKGTVFEVYFPGIPGSSPVEPETVKAYASGKELILFVDDEEELLFVSRLSLERLGYSVITASNGSEALKIFEKMPEKISLVITDQSMPQMKGIDLAEKVLTLRPGIPLILCTGLSDTIDMEKAASMDIKEILLKPFDLETLAGTITKLLK